MATIKSYTDLEQSKKLAEILPLESADMYYCYGMNIDTKKCDYDTVPTIIDADNQIDICDIPCWSLAALLEIIPYGQVNKDAVDSNKWETSSWNETDFDPILSIGGFDNPVDACYEMIIRLHELNLL